MKKFAICSLILLAAASRLSAWGPLGHETVIAIAQRHISEKTKANIAKYFDYDIKKDAVWMDKHRRDEDIAYTTAWHVYNTDKQDRYDPNPRVTKGDCVSALYLAEYNLRHYKELSDSAVVMNVRMLIHFVGDLHCPVHPYIGYQRNFWECSLNGEKLKSFHALYDAIPNRMWPGMKADEIAAQLDDCGACKRHRIAKGNFCDWAKATSERCRAIYEINAPDTVELDPDTVEKSRGIVSLQIKDAGYRLARLLDEYFGK